MKSSTSDSKIAHTTPPVAIPTTNNHKDQLNGNECSILTLKILINYREKKYIAFFKSAKHRLNSESKRGNYNTSQSSKKNEDKFTSQKKQKIIFLQKMAVLKI